MSNTRKILWAIAAFYVGGLILLIVIFGATTHKNNEFQPQNEFKLTNWVHLGVFSINRAVLYLFLAALLHGRHDAVDRAAHASASQQGADSR